MTPSSQHWLHRFKSERTDALACPSLPGAVSLPRRRVGNGTVPPVPTGCHTLVFPSPTRFPPARPDTVSGSDPPKGVRLGGSSIHSSVGVSSRTAKKAVYNKIEHKPPKPRLILLAEDSPPATAEGLRLKFNRGEHAGQLSALAGQSPVAILLSLVTVSGGSGSAKSGVICSNRGIDHSFPSYG